MNRFRNILQVVDASTQPDRAVERAVTRAKEHQARLRILDVVPTPPPTWMLPDGGPDIDPRVELINERHRQLEALVRDYHEPPDIAIEVRTGRRFLEVIGSVLRHEHDLVIKDADDPDWTDRLFGSDDMHLLRKCPCPVQLEKTDPPAIPGCIMAAVDFDPFDPDSAQAELNQRILELASTEALRTGAELHVLHVWNAPAEGLLQRWSPDPVAARSEYLGSLHAHHRDHFEQLRQELNTRLQAEVVPRFHLLQGSPVTLLPRQARELNADLVVMGTLARTGISGLFMGNTAEAVLDQLRCSVLAVKPPGFRSPVRLEA
jgi:nucleotide-binding universal stress UspA family protein